jgi:exodeoxyribonuclease V
VFVMRNKGLSQAQTMHSMMYNPDGKDKNGRPIFRKKQGIPYGLVVVDEGSMVSKELNQDLLSFGVKVLYVGDHWQLEPVGENPNLMAKPDIVLEKIHRQARDSNILMFADAVYRGQSYFPHRKLYDLEVAPSHRFWPALKEVEIGLVSKNDVRLRANEHVRRQKGFSGPLPQVGERVICLRNDRDCGVYNGLLGTVTKTSLQKKVYMIDVVDDLENKYEDLPTFPSQYGRNSMADTVEREFLLFDYGYVLTVHKAQGSEWNSGVVLEVDLWPGMEHNRWRYTAVTRIAKRLIYCR